MTNEETKITGPTPLTMKLVRTAENTSIATQYLINSIQLDSDRSQRALDMLKRYVDLESELAELNNEVFGMKKEWVVQRDKKRNNEPKKVTALHAKDIESVESGDQKEAV